MRSRHHSPRVYGGAIAAAALLGGALGLPAAAAAAEPSPAPLPIAPHQSFLGQVNDVTTGAVIKVGCFGPVTPASTGHPVAGQSVAVVPAPVGPVTSPVGYTGESATRVLVEFANASSVNAATVLTHYGVKAAIPTGLNLPCYGTGRVAFAPSPTSATARPAVVQVTYQSVIVGAR